MAQKGLATAPDNWKMEVDTAHGAGHAGTPVLSCVFDGATRKVRVVSKTTFAPGTGGRRFGGGAQRATP